MRTTYAVAWQEANGPVREGRLELQEGALRIDSANAVCELPYREVSAVRLGPGTIGGRQALVVERRIGQPIRIASVAQEAMVSELAQRLATLVLAGRKTSRVVVVLPIQADAREAVRELLSEGPPFDPEASGLEAHYVFLTEDEVIFIFEAPQASVLRRLAADLELLAAAEAWRKHAAGPARIAEEAFSWTRPDFSEGLSFAATPGPGDSEGGDLYPP